MQLLILGVQNKVKNSPKIDNLLTQQRKKNNMSLIFNIFSYPTKILISNSGYVRFRVQGFDILG